MRGNEGPPPGASASAISAVLGNDDLLREILLHLGFPTTLVRAALVAKRWLRHASDPAFLHRFRDRHPPALLGFYLREARLPRPRFVPVSEALELAAAVRRAGSIAEEKFYIRDIRDGRLLLCDLDATARQQAAALSPLHPTRGEIVIPSPQREHNSLVQSFLLLEKGGNGDAGAVEVLPIGKKLQVRRYIFQSGVWVTDSSAVIHTPETLPCIWRLLMPVCGKIYTYLLTDTRQIVRLDMATANCCVFQLPERIKTGNFKLSCAQEDSGLILIHAEGYLLNMWRLAANIDDVNGWELVYDRIPVREACNRHEDVMVRAVDAIDFVFLCLKESKAIICMHLRSRTEKAYDNMLKPQFMAFVDIFPFKMVWPPTFPALGEENNQEE